MGQGCPTRRSVSWVGAVRRSRQGAGAAGRNVRCETGVHVRIVVDPKQPVVGAASSGRTFPGTGGRPASSSVLMTCLPGGGNTLGERSSRTRDLCCPDGAVVALNQPNLDPSATLHVSHAVPPLHHHGCGTIPGAASAARACAVTWSPDVAADSGSTVHERIKTMPLVENSSPASQMDRLRQASTKQRQGAASVTTKHKRYSRPAYNAASEIGRTGMCRANREGYSAIVCPSPPCTIVEHCTGKGKQPLTSAPPSASNAR